MTREAIEVSLAWGAASHRGVRRLLNEDRFLAAGSVFFVADGMGGHDAGEIASAAAIEALRPLVELGSIAPLDVLDCLVEAQSAVRAISTEPGRGAGTTVTGVVVAEQEGMPCWLVTNVGDSRTYRLADGALAQISVDHSEVQEMIDAGLLTDRQALSYPRRHVVTRALGSPNDLQPDFWYLPIAVGDRILICSDGLTGELTNERIGEILAAVADPQQAADRLVHEAIAAGGRDNITVVVIDATGVARTRDDSIDPGDGRTSPEGDTLPRDVRLQMGGMP